MTPVLCLFAMAALVAVLAGVQMLFAIGVLEQGE